MIANRFAEQFILILNEPQFLPVQPHAQPPDQCLRDPLSRSFKEGERHRQDLIATWNLQACTQVSP